MTHNTLNATTGSQITNDERKFLACEIHHVQFERLLLVHSGLKEERKSKPIKQSMLLQQPSVSSAATSWSSDTVYSACHSAT